MANQNDSTSAARVSAQEGALAPDARVEDAAAEAKQRAITELAERQRLQAEQARADAEAAQAKSQFPPADQGQTLKVSGDVKLRYLGPDGMFVFGLNEDGERVVAVPGGEPVSVSEELAAYCLSLPHDIFEKVS